MKLIALALAVSTAFAPALVSANPVASADPVAASAMTVPGTWINPKGTVKVKTGNCGTELCGWIVWANDQAISDARDAGVDKLVGTVLLQDYHSTGADRWQGRVYVPDMGGTYFSRMELLDPNHLKISGCVLGGWICKSQIWVKD